METSQQLEALLQKVQSTQLPTDLSMRVTAMINRLKLIEKETSFITEYDAVVRYIGWISSLPWQSSTDDILDLSYAKKILDQNHYGLADVKDKVLEYVSMMILKKNRGQDAKFSHAPTLSLVGFVGTGKTTIAYSIADALGRKVVRIPFGGLGSATMIRGQERSVSGAEPGAIIKALIAAKSNNPVILLDEIDRVAEDVRADIMGVLIELLDPEQNMHFVDYYIDFPFDLSHVLFITTSNNTKDISNAVLDQLEVIQMPSYTDAEKREIAKTFMLPKILTSSGLSPHEIVIADAVWDSIIRPLGYDPGIRTLQRTLEGMVRKIARQIVEGKYQNGQTINITENNVKEYIPQW